MFLAQEAFALRTARRLIWVAVRFTGVLHLSTNVGGVPVSKATAPPS